MKFGTPNSSNSTDRAEIWHIAYTLCLLSLVPNLALISKQESVWKVPKLKFAWLYVVTYEIPITVFTMGPSPIFLL